MLIVGCLIHFNGGKYMSERISEKDQVTENQDIQTTKDKQLKNLSTFEEMDKLFDQFLKTRWSQPFFGNFSELKRSSIGSEVRVPSVDVVEKESNVIVRAEIPGIDKNNVDISLDGNNLTIQGKNKHEKREAGEEYHHCEILTGSFSRTLTLPADVDGEKVKATFANGLLEITLPKAENRKRNKISID